MRSLILCVPLIGVRDAQRAGKILLGVPVRVFPEMLAFELVNWGRLSYSLGEMVLPSARELLPIH